MQLRKSLCFLLALLLLAAAIVACGFGAAGAPTPTPVFLLADGPAGDKGDELAKLSSQDRLIVRTADVTIQANDVAKALNAVLSLGTEMGGYVVSSIVAGEEQEQRASASIRVPADKFDAAMERIRSLATKVQIEQTKSQNVTEEYVDLESRLRNLEQTEQQYLRLMERAATVEDVLKVQKELSSIQGQIEQAKGRMQYLERTSATSLINVGILSTASAKAIVRQGWNPGATSKDSLRDLTTFGQGLADLLIRMAIFAPVWATVLVIVVLLLRWQMRRDRATRTQPPGQAPQGPGRP